MKGSEWSLIFFTLLMQLAAGWVITFSILQLKAFDFNSALEKGIASKITLILIPIIVIALISSFLHLGSPLKAVYVFNNITSSWLSIEIFSALLFSVSSAFLIFAFNGSSYLFEKRNIICLITSLTGLMLLFSMSKIYMLETVPAWNKLSTPILFASSSFILGALLFAGAAVTLWRESELSFLLREENVKYLKYLIVFVCAFLAVETIVFVLQNYTGGANSAEIESRRIIFEENTFIFGVRVVLNLALLAGLIYLFQNITANKYYAWILKAAAPAVLISEIIGRYLFYAMYSRIGM